MTRQCSGPNCENQLAECLPGISVDESPFWALTREDKDSDREVLGTHETLHFCSDSCVKEFIES